MAMAQLPHLDVVIEEDCFTALDRLNYTTLYITEAHVSDVAGAAGKADRLPCRGRSPRSVNPPVSMSSKQGSLGYAYVIIL